MGIPGSVWQNKQRHVTSYPNAGCKSKAGTRNINGRGWLRRPGPALDYKAEVVALLLRVEGSIQQGPGDNRWLYWSQRAGNPCCERLNPQPCRVLQPVDPPNNHCRGAREACACCFPGSHVLKLCRTDTSGDLLQCQFHCQKKKARKPSLFI